MDANGLKFYMLAKENDWSAVGDPAKVKYDSERSSLRLSGKRYAGQIQPGTVAGRDPVLLRSETDDKIERIPQALDAYGTRAFWDPDESGVMAVGAFPDPVVIYKPESGTPTDLAMGHDGILYIAIDEHIVMLDRRGRWRPHPVRKEGFAAWRISPAYSGGIWVLDRQHRSLGMIQGRIFPEILKGDTYDPDTFRPVEENMDPPELEIIKVDVCPANETPVAIACSPNGRLAVLSQDGESDSIFRVLHPDGVWSSPITLSGSSYAFSMEWVDEKQVALLLSDCPKEAPVFLLNLSDSTGGGTMMNPSGDYYPLRDHDGGPFLKGNSRPLHYPVVNGISTLYRISLLTYEQEGEARNRYVVDSKNTQTVWHRIYLEADIPEGCGIRVLLAVVDDPAIEVDNHDWYEHRIGRKYFFEKDRLPKAAWVPEPSEIPFHPGFSLCKREKDRSGLFTVLIQRSGRQVTALKGRYLKIRVVLCGNGRSTPELWAVRAHASRFSYLENYLPALYHENEFGGDGNKEELKPATRADFLERFLDNFEGILTPLEDRIAHSYLLTGPATAPPEALEWLGSWIGLSFDSAWPESGKRKLLEKAHQLFRMRGTCDGLKLALNLATGNAVDTGRIIILEEWRLRRIFATILGADFSDEDNPLLPGLTVSGNSYVGDTLFLGDESKKEFLALFHADFKKSQKETKAVQDFYNQRANRVLIMVHQDVSSEKISLVRRVVELETPAHIVSRIEKVSRSLIVGLSSLVGLDTFLEKESGPERVQVDQSRIGRRGILMRPPSLDPRIEGGV